MSAKNAVAVIAAHVLYAGRDEDGPSQCGCGLVEPDEVTEANDAKAVEMWWAGHVAEAIGLPALLERVEAAEEQVRQFRGLARARVAQLSAVLDDRDSIEAERDALAAKVADDSLILTTAKASWDRGERDYWDYESDMRPFDPSVIALDGDDCDRGKEWLETVTEIITDFRTALTEGTEGA